MCLGCVLCQFAEGAPFCTTRFFRNQGLLQLVAEGASEYLTAPPAPSLAPEGSSPLKVSLFSLGNMCTHRECAQELLMLNIRGVVAPLAASEDATVRRYVERIEVRVSQCCFSVLILVMHFATASCYNMRLFVVQRGGIQIVYTGKAQGSELTTDDLSDCNIITHRPGIATSTRGWGCSSPPKIG